MDPYAVCLVTIHWQQYMNHYQLCWLLCEGLIVTAHYLCFFHTLLYNSRCVGLYRFIANIYRGSSPVFWCNNVEHTAWNYSCYEESLNLRVCEVVTKNARQGTVRRRNRYNFSQWLRVLEKSFAWLVSKCLPSVTSYFQYLSVPLLGLSRNQLLLP